MSIDNVSKALELILDEEECDVAGLQPESLILEAEDLLGLAFPSDYRYFLGRVGCLGYGGLEIYGITGGDLLSPCVPNGIWYTLNSREMGMGDNLFLINHFELGSPAIRFSESIDESPIVAYYQGFAEEAQTYEVLAPDFGSYMLEQVLVIKEELESL